MIKRERSTVETALETVVDALFERDETAMSGAVLRKAPDDADEGSGIGLGADLSVAAQAAVSRSNRASVTGWTRIPTRA